MFFWTMHADDLWNISINYCDTANNTVQYQIVPGVETSICYTLSNSTNGAPVTVKIWFIDGTFTNDQLQNKACLSDADVEDFWRYVTSYDQFISLQPGETIQKEAKLLYPIGSDGLYHGCMVYSIVQEETGVQTANTSFSILMRRAKFIDVIVGNPELAESKENLWWSLLLIAKKIENILPENLKDKLDITDALFGSDEQKTIVWDKEEEAPLSIYILSIGLLVLIWIILLIKNPKRKGVKKAAHHHPVYKHKKKR